MSKILQRSPNDKEDPEPGREARPRDFQLDKSDHVQSEAENLPIPPATAGFLGSTSFQAAFDYSKTDEIDVMHQNSNANIRGVSASTKAPSLESPTIREGAEVLAVFMSMSPHLKSLDRWYILEEVPDASPYVRECIDYVEEKSGHGSPEGLLVLAHQIATSTAKPSPFYFKSTVQDFLNFISGDQLCWEPIGIMLEMAGLSALVVHEVRDLDDHQMDIDWLQMARTFFHAGSKCIQFCNQYGHLNDLGMNLMIVDLVLHAQINGDADYMSWRKLGDVTAAIFALGLHQEPNPNAGHPFFMCELRKRAFWLAFLMDKSMATFFGRPPLIGSKFCSAVLPLDLPLEALGLTGDDLARRLDELDADGWHPGKAINRSTLIRSTSICLGVREKALELSLGPNNDQLEAKAKLLLRTNQEIYEDHLPSKMRDKNDQWTDKRSSAGNFFVLHTRLEFLYTDFLVQKTLVRRARLPAQNLIDVSKTLLSTLLVVTNNRHRQGFYVALDLPWLISLFGLAAAGVLALELLQQSAPQHTDSADFPRSQVIQQLSVMISSIDSVIRPSHGNYQICLQAKKSISAILDTVLSNSKNANSNFGSQNVNEQSTADANGASVANSTGIIQANETEVPGLDDQQWLEDNFDLDFWTNLEDHPLLTWPDMT